MPGAFLLLVRHADHGEFPGVTIDIAGEPLAECGRIAGISFYSGALLVELARRDHVTVRADREQLPIQPEAEATRLVDDRGGGARDKRRQENGRACTVWPARSSPST